MKEEGRITLIFGGYFSAFQDGYQLGRSLGLWTKQGLSTQTLYRWVVPHTPPIHTSRLQENDPPH